jgi:hypothetical protein
MALKKSITETAENSTGKSKVPTGEDLLKLAASRIGGAYVYGANVDLNDPNWGMSEGQNWDCAEFCTWAVKQITGKTYGCLDNADTGDPEPYTGGWKKDVRKGVVKQIAVNKAVRTPGAILLRYREGGKHIVFSAGDWGTIEAKSEFWGVCRGTVGNTSRWDYGILIPDVKYKEGVK